MASLFHAKRLERNSEPQVRSILAQLHKVFTPPPHEANSLKAKMYEEILSRCTHDIAGNLQSDAMAESNLHKLGGLYDSLAPILGDQTAFELLLNNITAYNKVFVQTPHPTETLSKHAIQAEEDIMQALEQAGLSLFKGADYAALSRSDQQAISKSLSNLYHSLIPVEEPLSIREEMSRSVVFSQRVYDAVPVMAKAILKATHRNSSELSNDELDHFSHLLRADTWSPGDRDSKPNMTCAEMEEGIRLNRRAMFRHYFRDVLRLGAMSQFTGADPEAANALYTIMHRLLETAKPYEPQGKVVKAKTINHDDNASYAKDDIIVYMQHEYGEYLHTPFWQGFETFLQSHATPEPYASQDDNAGQLPIFRDDLLKLRQFASLQQATQPNGTQATAEEEGRLTLLDQLIIQAGNFGHTALKSQVRQNARIHSQVCEYLQHVLQKAGVDADLGSMDGINHFLDGLEADASLKQRVQHVISEKLGDLETQKIAHHLDKPHEAEFNFYQTLNGLRIVAENPDVYPRYLIAECEEAVHIMQVLTMLKLVEPEGKTGRVEVVPLVETPELVMEKAGHIAYVDMMKEVLQNTHFREHQNRVSARNYDQLLKDYTLNGGNGVEEQALSVADIKRQYHLPLSDGDESKTIETAKLCMGAGSDVTKAGGIAAAAVMQHAMQKLREELLTLDKPVLLIDYLGCGGGVHRTQPVSNSVETVQGRSLRQSPGNIAKKALNLLSHFIGNRLKTDEHAQDEFPGDPLKGTITYDLRKRLAQLNLGNMANLVPNENEWQHVTRDVCNQAIERYQELYTSEEFKELISHSANIFVGLTSFAARPLARVDKGGASSGTKHFPPSQRVDTLRAIGYGASLNASGSCASLYYGLGKLAEMELPQIRQAYLYDPLMQDTINRASYGIAMADMDTAWKYVGEDKMPDLKTLHDLADYSPQADERLALAKKALAKISLEYEQLLHVLVPLHHSIAHAGDRQGVKPTQEQLIADLPEALRSQIETSKSHIKPARRALANLFNQYVSDEVPRPDLSSPETALAYRQSDAFKERIYPSMVTLMEAFEHAPRAYTRPYWAAKTPEVENSMSVS